MELERLMYVDNIREIWPNEAANFTPWLADHLDLLGEELGLDLELQGTEQEVGSFSLDIYAKEVGSGDTVIIENQLEQTDHSHLGQLLTYASGLEAKIIIWISTNVREEHRKAMDWLNQNSSEEIQFFAVEIQVVKIGDSPPAPLFKVKASPNEWSKEQKTRANSMKSAARTEKEKYYHQFFSQLIEKIKKEMPGYTNRKSIGYDSWFDFPAGRSEFRYDLHFRGGRFSCELYICSQDKEMNKSIFDKLHEQRENIETITGPLSWERLDNRKGCRVADYIDITTDEAMIRWGMERLKAFKQAFGKHLNLSKV